MINSISECDASLKAYLQGFTFVKGTETIVVPVMFINPQAQLVDKDFPTIAISSAGAYQDPSRWQNGEISVVTSLDEKGKPKTYAVEPIPDPYVLYYAVRVHTISSRDRAEIQSFIAKKFRRDAFLVLNGEDSPITQVSYRNPNSTSEDFGNDKRNENKEIVDQYLIKVETRLRMVSAPVEGTAITDVQLNIDIK